jgi:hypothetical protein
MGGLRHQSIRAIMMPEGVVIDNKDMETIRVGGGDGLQKK